MFSTHRTWHHARPEAETRSQRDRFRYEVFVRSLLNMYWDFSAELIIDPRVSGGDFRWSVEQRTSIIESICVGISVHPYLMARRSRMRHSGKWLTRLQDSALSLSSVPSVQGPTSHSADIHCKMAGQETICSSESLHGKSCRRSLPLKFQAQHSEKPCKEL